ncbi:MAG: tetratricopeptide repeat protein [Candidatus Polarisedimenticolaceae bacterium]|nr:tetratricopeptide repeat protein [Candidatus Polarisedimenticolaceae bacterium]
MRPVASISVTPEIISESGNAKSTSLSADMIYEVLLGEIAAQRGDHKTAFLHYKNALNLNNEPRLAERATQLALNTGKPNNIRIAARLWLNNAPDQPTPHKILALLNIQEKNIGAAKKHLEEIIRIAKSQNKEGYILISNTLEKANNPTLALTLLQQLTESATDNPNALLALALTAGHARRYDLVNDALYKALLLKPKWPQALMLLSTNAMAQNNPTEAQRILKTAVEKSPDEIVLRYTYAQLLMETSHFNDSYEQFLILNNKQPPHPNFIFTLGILAKQLEKPEQAKDHFKQLIELKKRTDDARHHLGQIEEHLGNNREAIDWYNLVKGEKETDAKIRIAVLFSREREIGKAREVLQRLRVTTPHLAARIYLVEGSLLMDAGEIETSMSIFSDAIKQFPENTSLLYARSILHSILGEIELLENDLQRAIKIDPNHADSLNALGYALADQTTRYSEALGYIERALQIKPDHPAILDSMGWVLFRLGKNDEAITYLRRAMELQPDPEIAAHLGEALWTTGKTIQAQQVWDKAQASDPDSDYLNNVIRRHQ